MKMKLIIALLAFFLIVQAYSQQQSKCSHTSSFEKSWISDTLDALSYTIHLTSFDFTNHEITAQTEVELASKVDNLNDIKLELMDLTVDEVHSEWNFSSEFSARRYDPFYSSFQSTKYRR